MLSSMPLKNALQLLSFEDAANNYLWTDYYLGPNTLDAFADEMDPEDAKLRCIITEDHRTIVSMTGKVLYSITDQLSPAGIEAMKEEMAKKEASQA